MPHRAWNKGLTKKNHTGLARIAKARRTKNNFMNWHKANPVYYAPLRHSSDLAELYGTMLGDGCLENHPRTERLIISFNSKETSHIERIRKIIEKLFQKSPSLRIHKMKRCIDISLYQKNISRRLNFPKGIKLLHQLSIPKWIKEKRAYLLPCLRGLFESDGCWVIDSKYNTNVITYTSASPELLTDLHRVIKKLGFDARMTTRRVTINKRKQVQKFVNLIKFRHY